MTDATPTDGTQMYRLYDTEGTLLYVGISWSALSRITQHKTEKPWWPTVTRVDITTIPGDRSAAETAERNAIYTEQPLHNIIHNRTRPPERPPMTSPNNGSPPLVGYFAIIKNRGWQARIVAVADPYVIVDTYSWMTGSYYQTRVCPFDEIIDWQLYEDHQMWLQAGEDFNEANKQKVTTPQPSRLSDQVRSGQETINRP